MTRYSILRKQWVARPLLILGLLSILVLTAQAAVNFSHAFSPQQGLTVPVEQPWRQEICLNGSWEFQPVALPEDYDLKKGAPVLDEPDPNGWSSTPIRIPSPWNVNAFGWGNSTTFPSYPAEWETACMGWLRRQFTVPDDWNGKRLILHFEAVCGYAQVVVNGHLLAEHFDNSLPFEVDATEFINRNGDNELLVGVRQASLFDIPGKYGKITYPSGSPWTRQTIGIWQDVFLQGVPALRVDDVAIRPLVDQGVLELVVTVRNNTPDAQDFSIGGQVVPWINEAGEDMISAAEPRWSLGKPVLTIAATSGNVGPRMTSTLTIRLPVNKKLEFWTMDTPNLYGLVLDVAQNDQVRDRCYERFGWRQWSIEGRNITLNGKPVTLLGDTGHILGVQYLTRRFAWSWYHALKLANGNAIRLHATVRPRFYLELADEMGIAILDESDIYNSTTDINYYPPETWLRFQAHIDAMVKRDRNYPCVFGWSIANEILSALWWIGVPRHLWQPIIEKSADLADRIRVLDPTRPWISSDGDGDLHGRLPTFVYHYGNPPRWLRFAPEDKPFGVGEGGSMLWGSPAVFSKYNGERSYESIQGMMEGVARELYWYLVEQRKIAAYCCIFTFEGSAFRPLPIGAADPAKPPGEDDGIVFGPFVEGQPGMQPERIAAYCTNFNPGYDPDVPFIDPTPVFEAVKAAYAPGGPAPCEFDHFAPSSELPPPPSATIRNVRFIGDPKGNLKQALDASGVQAGADNSVSTEMLIIDGATLSKSQVSDASDQLQNVLEGNGSVFVWTAPENLDNINAVLPEPVSFVQQEAMALLADREAPETASISLASLYFQDQADKVIVRHQLAGPLVEKSRTLMQSNVMRMRRRFGRTSTNNGPVLIANEMAGGKLLVTSLPPDVRTERRRQLMRNLFANLGVQLSEPNKTNSTGFDGAGFLNEALVIGSFQGQPYPEILDHDFLGGEARVSPKAGDRVGDRIWRAVSLLGDGSFDFFRLKLPGTEGTNANSLYGKNLRPEALDGNGYLEPPERLTIRTPGVYSVAYLSFWLYTPRALDASAAAADAPKLSLLTVSDDGKKIWLNERQIIEDKKLCGPGSTNSSQIPLTLKKGWNHFLVKAGQQDGPWSFSARFECSDPGLLGKIRAAAVPDQP